MIILHVKSPGKFGDIIDGRFFQITSHHFLKAGHVRLEFFDQADHILLSFRMCFEFDDVKVFHIPAHDPEVGGMFLNHEVWSKS